MGQTMGGKLIQYFRGVLCLAFAFMMIAEPALGEVYIDQEKPADWEERSLLRIYALYSLDCDAFVLECCGKTMVLDGGKNESNLIQFLREHDILHPDIIFNSHPHDDHIDAVYFALRNDHMTTDVFISPFRENYPDAADTFQRRVVKVLAEKEIPYRQVTNGEVLQLGEAEMTVYHYDGKTRKPNGGSMTVNDMSGVLRVCFGDASILLTADIGGTIQQMLAKDYGPAGLKSDILKAPHHGKNAINGDLLKAVDPKLTLITGKVSRTEDCRKQLEHNGIEWKRTSYGNITMETDGKDWYVNQEDTFGELEKLRKQKERQEKRKKKK